MLVGITGRKHHGKDTAAQRFVAQGYAQLRFADPLKNMLRAFYRTCGVDDAMTERKIEGDLKEVECEWLSGKTPRHAMQSLGAEWGRLCISETLWVDILLRRAALAGNAVVSDVRYENECAAIKSQCGIVAKVDASKRVPPNEFSNHSSETAVDLLPVDNVLDNNGAQADLVSAVDQLCRDLSWVESASMSPEIKTPN